MGKKILNDLARGSWFQLQTQFIGETAMYVDNPQKVLGGIKKSLTDYELRIDYTQHNISSLLGMYSILTEKTN